MGKPAFAKDGILYEYVTFRKHINLHPTPSVIKTLRNELEALKSSDNTIQFLLENPIPQQLITKIAKLRVFEKSEKLEMNIQKI